MSTISKMMTALFEDLDDSSMVRIVEEKGERQALIDNIVKLYSDPDVAAKFDDPSTEFANKDEIIKKIKSKSGLQNLKTNPTLKTLESKLTILKKQVDADKAAAAEASEETPENGEAKEENPTGSESSEDAAPAPKNIENANPATIMSDEEKARQAQQIKDAEGNEKAMSKIKDDLVKKAVGLLSDIDDNDLKQALDANGLEIDKIQNQQPKELLNTLTKIRDLSRKYQLVKSIVNAKDNVEQDKDEFDKQLKDAGADLADLTLPTLLAKSESDLNKIKTKLQANIDDFNKTRSEKKGKETANKNAAVTNAQETLIQKIKFNYFKYDVKELVERKYLEQFPYTFKDIKGEAYKTILKTQTSKASKKLLDELVPLDDSEKSQFAQLTGKANEDDGNTKLKEVLDSITRNNHGGKLEQALQKLHDDIFDLVKGEKDLTQYTNIQVPQEATTDKSALNTWNQSVKFQIKLLDDMRQHKATNDQVSNELDAKRTEWDLFIVPLPQLKFPGTKTDSKMATSNDKNK